LQHISLRCAIRNNFSGEPYLILLSGLVNNRPRQWLQRLKGKRLEKELDKHNENDHFCRSRPLFDSGDSGPHHGRAGTCRTRSGRNYQRSRGKETCEKAQESGEEHCRYECCSGRRAREVSRVRANSKQLARAVSDEAALDFFCRAFLSGDYDRSVMAQQEIATFGGGCFWCLEAVYQEAAGVRSVVSGYMGGTKPNPTYKEVCGGDSGHVEVVQVTFDPAVVAYRDLLEVFFAMHDPTTLNRQGNDVGTQYRSVIFYHSPEQKAAAEEIIRELAADKTFGDPIVTAVEAATEFYPAENYHQQYFENNPNQPYCAFVVAPKVAKFRKKFGQRLKAGA
jgi:peptide-methionine (S)-S-oxide reductase